MDESTTTLGAYLRRERERRGITLKAISDQTKVSVPLLEGLEADDLTRWPGGIFRRAFVRGYANSVGLDPDEVMRRFEEQHRPPEQEQPAVPGADAAAAPAQAAAPADTLPGRLSRWRARSSGHARVRGAAADLAVAVVLGLGSAAAGSRMLWPVLLIAAYYALGTLLTGSTPMMALLADEEIPQPVKPAPAPEAAARIVSRKGRHEAPRQRHGRLVVQGNPREARS